MLDPSLLVCGVSRSLSGQPWRWRGHAGADAEEEFSGEDLVDQLLRSRGVAPEELERHRNPTVRAFMPDPSIFRDMDTAATRLADAVEKGEAVTIFGDYDVDGATSAALLVRLLRGLGIGPTAYIPDRLMDGYGPSGKALVRLANEGAQLIVTVDCGAQAFEALEMARKAGVDVIVVDHHKCASALPVAHALVNPNRLDEEAEAASHGHLAAVGVCFLLAAAMVRTLRARGFFASREEPKLLDLLDLVALGTVADVASLKGLNRAFVTQGLKVMAQRRNVGLSSLIDAARLTKAPSCTDLGFALGPRINAGGRVGKSDLGVRLLTTEDPAEAEEIARELDRLNEERRAIEAAVCEAAEALCAAQANRAVILVAAERWHPGVIGIVAGRLKEKFGRPAIVVAIGEDGLGKGSGRSIGGVDLGAAILAAKDSGLLVAGGGHAMAAGLTVARERIAALGDFLDERLGSDVARSRDDRALLLDAVVAPRGVCPSLCDALEAGGPYGAGWPGPRVCAGPVRILKADVVGSGHLRLTLAGDDGCRVKAIGFRLADSEMGRELLAAPPHRKLWVAGRIRRDEYGDRIGAELHLDDAAWAD
ncbi:MAG TPA: single-stranded-DNA-specific exonuclease RecJ [Allosphingosinicella sp.]|nr:single-stranded-DNA-specific exonuclease RecJ [Allosphingosinicella sp.]